jgi:hypothetical protein
LPLFIWTFEWQFGGVALGNPNKTIKNLTYYANKMLRAANKTKSSGMEFLVFSGFYKKCPEKNSSNKRKNCSSNRNTNNSNRKII